MMLMSSSIDWEAIAGLLVLIVLGRLIWGLWGALNDPNYQWYGDGGVMENFNLFDKIPVAAFVLMFLIKFITS